MTEAKRAAGDKNVLVQGAATAQLALAAGVLDEAELARCARDRGCRRDGAPWPRSTGMTWSMTTGRSVESRMRSDPHVRFGGRPGETDRPQG
jgi:hypothetical protein